MGQVEQVDLPHSGTPHWEGPFPLSIESLGVLEHSVFGASGYGYGVTLELLGPSLWS